jgi:MoaA/NifB/PqqE/SkfB family radical SAM enzyme
MPLKQTEVQLGHLCNDRCVFCISGDRTHLGMAPLIPARLITAQLERAYAEGDRRVTFLGGEPTIQPNFMEVLEHAVKIGFEEIVVFTNGSKTGRSDLMDRAIATGANLEWRFSFQGATEEAHQATTRRKGSFTELLRSLRRADELEQRITINTCVVTQNYASVDRFPELLRPHRIHHLHLDMLHPDDMPASSIERMEEIMPRLSDLATPLRRMVAGFEPGFPVNIGNLPHCIAPDLFPWIEHGGQPTYTTTVDVEGRPTLNDRWNKYEAKESNKTKPKRCRDCVFDDACTGVFTPYHRLYGSDELQPVTVDAAARLPAADAQFGRWSRLTIERRVAGLGATVTVPDPGLVRVRLPSDTTVDVRGPRAAGSAGGSWFTLTAADEAALRDVGQRLLSGRPWRHPPADGSLRSARLEGILRRLRMAAPFGDLQWSAVRVEESGRRLELDLAGPNGERARVWFDDARGRPRDGYRIDEPFGTGASGSRSDASDALVAGIRALMRTLGRAEDPDPRGRGSAEPPGPTS